MAKNTFLSFSTTAGDNTDCGGIGILGTNSVSNFDNAFRTLMAILRGDLDNGTVFVTKATGYTAGAGDNNAFYEFTATATLALTAAATIAADWHMTVFANGGDVTIDPAGTELINGASTLTISNGDAAYIICTGAAFKAITIPSAGRVVDASVVKWVSKAIGELYAVDDSMVGADVPPTNDSRFRFIKLTAGLTGSGQYNDGILTTESVSGSAPLVSATAVVNLTGSPVNGRTVRLLNTESRFLRAGTSPGTVQNDQMQRITGKITRNASGVGFSPGTGALVGEDAGVVGPASGSTGTNTSIALDSANSPGARAGDETRTKNIQLTYYMRIK